jgi:hypothetical protein
MGNYLALAEDKTTLLCVADFAREADRPGAHLEPFNDILVDAVLNVTSVPHANEKLGQVDVAFYVACKRVAEEKAKAKTRPRRGEGTGARAYAERILKEYFKLRGSLRAI